MMIGKKILNYEIKSLLGEGGMGNVYLAEHAQLGRKVAIKMLHPRLASNESLRKRFLNEASAMAHLQHPNIVGLLDYVESDEGLFLIMEYVQGEELDIHIREVSGPIAEEKAKVLMSEILDAFNYAHNQGVVHRDIKPSNLLMTNDGRVKVLDFGIAKMLDDDKSMTKTGTQMGTVLYMSPEQVKGEKIDARTDIYSLGVTLYQMVTGRAPYSGDTTEYEVYTQIVKEPLPKASSVYPGVSGKIESIIDRATQKDKESRFQSCAEMKSALFSGVENNVVSTIKTSASSGTEIKNSSARLKIFRNLHKSFEAPSRFHISPNLPVNKVIRFLADNYNYDTNQFVKKFGKIQLFYDNSSWSNGKSGVLMSTEVLIIAESKNRRVARKWSEINKINLVKAKPGFVGVRLYCDKNGEESIVNIELSNMNQKFIKDLFELFKALF